MHKLDKEEFDNRKASKLEAKETLEVPHEPPKNVPELRERVWYIEKYLGIAQEDVS